jgi:hypothetical protein
MQHNLYDDFISDGNITPRIYILCSLPQPQLCISRHAYADRGPERDQIACTG